ncbi:uncharacterized protein PG998_010973 [Apiospora kogelbergensis]|uniref:Uncharacterized protein n=1 Tax=Apiospora kogelbergensis TaxID=1337665 RepID=A0AAW0RCX2_9PEZI
MSSSLDEVTQPRALFKGRLKAAQKPPIATASYTVSPAGQNEVTIRKTSDVKTPAEPMEVCSRAVAQPFVDPNVLERQARQKKMSQ